MLPVAQPWSIRLSLKPGVSEELYITWLYDPAVDATFAWGRWYEDATIDVYDNVIEPYFSVPAGSHVILKINDSGAYDLTVD